MSNKFLKNEVATIMFNDLALREYVISIICASTHLDYDFVKNNLELDNSHVNANSNAKFSTVDAIYTNDKIIFNIEINCFKSKVTDKKNFRYICNLALKQIPPGVKDNFKKIYQININDYDIFNKGDFIYDSIFMNTKYHLPRLDYVTIIDINMDYLRNLSYNQVKEKKDSLEYLLYIFICNDKDMRDKLYGGNEIMDKVNEKLKDLTKEFGSLYYDREEYENDIKFELGENKGRKEEKLEIAKKMLADKVDIKIITKYTELSEKEIENL